MTFPDENLPRHDDDPPREPRITAAVMERVHACARPARPARAHHGWWLAAAVIAVATALVPLDIDTIDLGLDLGSLTIDLAAAAVLAAGVLVWSVRRNHGRA